MLIRRQFNEDKRKNRRLISGSPVELVVIRHAFSGVFGIGRFTAKLRDKSIVGLRVQAPLPLQVNSLLKIWINPYSDSHKHHPLTLQGDVVWCKPAQDDSGSYYVGIRLRNNPTENMKVWITCVTEELRVFNVVD
jgi:hypothetical protein